MKIGIVTCGNDSMELFRFLHRYDHDYHIYYDANAWPLGDKDVATALSYVQVGYGYLVDKGVDVVIVPPLWELSMLDGDTVRYPKLLPLFRTYLFSSAFRYSLVGKLGVLCDPVCLSHDHCLGGEQKYFGQTLLQLFAKDYQLTSYQQDTKPFRFPFAYRCKDVRMRKYFLRSMQPRHYLINKVVKFDLTYFKDAMVDTLIPMNYAFFAFEKTIKRFFNFKKQRFHDLQSLEASFVQCIESLLGDDHDEVKQQGSGVYSVTVYCQGDRQMLLSRKRYVWLLQRGKRVEIEWEEVKN